MLAFLKITVLVSLFFYHDLCFNLPNTGDKTRKRVENTVAELAPFSLLYLDFRFSRFTISVNFKYIAIA